MGKKHVGKSAELFYTAMRINSDLMVYQYGHHECPPSHYYGPSEREYYLFHFIVKGKGEYTVGEKKYELKSGEGFLIKPGETTYYQADDMVLKILLFSVVPMLWLLMAFQDYKGFQGLFGSAWVGFDNFEYFFRSGRIWRAIWGYKESVTKNNYIAYNKIYDIGKGVLSDMGGVYLLGEQQGTKVYNNLIYNVKAREYGGWAIYTDEGCSYVTVQNNVCYDCSENCFHQHYGKMNVVKNNLFARAGAELCRITRGEMHLSAVFENNALVADGSAVYGLPDEEFIKRGAVQTRSNAVCGKRSKDVTVISGDKKFSFSGAQELGLERDSVLAAAKFEIFYNGEAEVSGDGILKSGYVPIKLTSVGIRK